MVSITKRQSQIIQFLLRKDDYITNNLLCENFGISPRTTRSDLQQIKAFLNENGFMIISAPNRGTKIAVEKEEKKNIEKLLLKIRTATNEERDDLAIMELLVKDRNTYESLAEASMVTKYTIINSIENIESKLQQYSISLIRSKGKGIFIQGDEYGLRRCFCSLINRNDYQSLLFAGILDTIRTEENRKLVSDIIRSVEENIDVSFFDEERLNIMLCYTISRIRKGKLIKDTNRSFSDTVKERNYSSYLKSLSAYDFPEIEKTYICSLFMNTKIRSLKRDADDGSKSNEIAAFLMEELEKLHPLNKEEKSKFLLGLASHLDVALYRMRNGIPIYNSLRDQVKICLPLTYDFTKKQLAKCEKIFDVSFNEDEISFIAMYVGSTYETSVKIDTMINVLLVCSFGMTTSSILESRMRQTIPDCHFAGPLSKNDALRYLEKNHIDLIISTNNEDYGDVRTIVVNPLLYREDVDYIRAQLFEINYDKMCRYFLDRYSELHEANTKTIYIKDIIPDEYIQIEDTAASWQESIRVASRPLVKDGKIRNVYVEKMIKAVDDLGTYMVLLPETSFVHAGIEDGINEECCAMLVLKKPLMFGESNSKKVRNIVVIAIKDKNKTPLLDLVNILNSRDNLSKLKSSSLTIEEIKNLHD